MAKHYTVLSTGELITAIHQALTQGYSRRLRPETIDKLDDDGKHVVSMSILEDKLMEKPKARCLLFMKFTGDDAPHIGWLDIDLGVFNGYQQMEAV